MKKTKVELNKKLSLNKETITGLNQAQQQEIEGGKDAETVLKCQISGSGCDCQRVTCGIIACTAVGCVPQSNTCADM